MDIEQPTLGRIGVDSFTISLDYSWEHGWTLRSSSRLSGSQTFTQHAYQACADDEVLELVVELVAEALGLV